MIDLVFVLTNKLDANVKDIRKTVHDNQNDNLSKMEDIINTQNSNLEQRDKEIDKLKEELMSVENRITILFKEQGILQSETKNLRGIVLFRYWTTEILLRQ